MRAWWIILREAINAANANPDASPITFAPNVTGVITLTLGELKINQNLTILGPGTRTLAISGNNSSRVFNLSRGTVFISSLTLTNGRVVGTNGNPGQMGGGSGGPGGGAYGGGIYNGQASLTLSNCSIVGNTVQGGVGGAGGADDAIHPGGRGGFGGLGAGGGIYDGGQLTLINCTVSGNAAIGGAGGNGFDAFDNFSFSGGGGGSGGSGEGGGVSVFRFTMTNCTLSGNAGSGGAGGRGGNGFEDGSGGQGGPGGFANGGGLSDAAVQLNQSMVSCTVSHNSLNAGVGGVGGTGGPGMAPSGSSGTTSGGGLSIDMANPLIQNCVIAGNSGLLGPDFYGLFVNSGGHNLLGIREASEGGFNGMSDQTGNRASPLDPLLGPLLPTAAPSPSWPYSPAVRPSTKGMLVRSPPISAGDCVTQSPPSPTRRAVMAVTSGHLNRMTRC